MAMMAQNQVQIAANAKKLQLRIINILLNEDYDWNNIDNIACLWQAVDANEQEKMLNLMVEDNV